MVNPDVKILTCFSLETSGDLLVPLEDITSSTGSYSCGFNQAFGWGLQSFLEVDMNKNAALFPIGLSKSVSPGPYLDGWEDGLKIVSCMEPLIFLPGDFKIAPLGMIYGRLFRLCRLLGSTSHAVDMFQTESLRDELVKNSGWIPPSFPVNRFDMGSLISRFFLKRCKDSKHTPTWKKVLDDLVVFDELNNTKDRVLLDILSQVFSLIVKNNCQNPSFIKKNLRNWKHMLNNLLKIDHREGVNREVIYRPKVKVRVSGSELRHGLNMCKMGEVTSSKLLMGDEIWGKEELIRILFQKHETNTPIAADISNSNIIQKDPSISGLRTVRLATGSHYKLRSILKTLEERGILKQPKKVICAGDGSGGIGSCCLRLFPDTRVAFNSLISSREEIVNGMEPQGPFAITCLPESYRSRCINLKTFWSHPSDLTELKTLRYLSELFNNSVDLLICDAEPYHPDTMRKIVGNLDFLVSSSLVCNTIIIKRHSGEFVSNKGWNGLISRFKSSFVVRSQFASSHSHELYLIMSGLHDEGYGRIISDMTKKEILDLMRTEWRDSKKEFARAILIYQTNMTQGVDKRLLPDCKVDLEEFLNDLGISYKDRNHISASILNAKKPKDLIVVMKTIRKLGMREHWKVPKGSLSDIIPTFGRVSCVFNILFGMSIFLALSLEDHTLHSKILKAINTEFITYTRSKEYLPQIQIRGKWTSKSAPLAKGDVVIIKDDCMPPARWKLGLVMELHPGSDGVARVVTLRTANGTHMRRPVIKLCRLPTDKEIIPVESQDFQRGENVAAVI